MIINKTFSDYGNREYMRITGDIYMKEVPPTLWELWYGDGSHSIALSNIEFHFLRAKNGEEDMALFCENLSELRCDLANEFNNLINNNVVSDDCYDTFTPKSTMIY